MKVQFYASLFVFLLFVCIVDCKVASGSLSTPHNFHYLTKFCYKSQGPPFEYSITLGEQNTHNYSTPVLALFAAHPSDPSRSSWWSVYNKDSMSCEEKISGAGGLTLPVVSGQVNFSFPIQSERAMYWYIAVADCASTDGLSVLSYRVHMTNYGSHWDREFSFDEIGLIDIYLGFFVLYCVGICAHIYGIWQMYKLGALHTILKVLSIAIFLVLGYLMCAFIHYVIYMENGVGSFGFKGFGDLLHMASIVVLMFLTILLGKGWAITSAYLTSRKFLAIVMVGFVIAYMSLFIWDVVGRDPASTSYFYDSIPGLIVLVLRGLTWVWFLWCVYLTYKLEALPKKRRFYLLLAVGITAWYLSLIIYVVIAVILEPWVPKKITIVTGMVLFTDTLAFGFLNFLLWPSRAAEYFEKIQVYALGTSGIAMKSNANPKSHNPLISDENL